MKASELRIGNWIELPSFNGDGENIIADLNYHPFTITSTQIIDAEYYGKDWAGRPIPLTEEWLVRLGFYKQLNYDEPPYYFTNQPLHITVKRFSGIYREKNNFKLLGNGLDIKHVHQLQNLYFALTGEELSCQSYPNSK